MLRLFLVLCNCKQLFMHINNWDKGVAPAYLVLVNIDYQPKPLLQLARLLLFSGF